MLVRLLRCGQDVVHAGDISKRNERPTIAVGKRDEQLTLHQHNEIGIGDVIPSAIGEVYPKRLERFPVRTIPESSPDRSF
jgi:hypothetical protein